MDEGGVPHVVSMRQAIMLINAERNETKREVLVFRLMHKTFLNII